MQKRQYMLTNESIDRKIIRASINYNNNNKCMYNKSLCMRAYSQFENVNRRSHLTEIKIDSLTYGINQIRNLNDFFE